MPEGRNVCLDSRMGQQALDPDIVGGKMTRVQLLIAKVVTIIIREGCEVMGGCTQDSLIESRVQIGGY